MLKQVFSHSALYTMSSILHKGISFLVFPIYARILNPDEYGLIDILLAIAAVVKITIALEVTSSVGRFFSLASNKLEKEIISSTAFIFSLIAYAIFCIFLITVPVELWQSFGIHPTKQILIIFTAYLFFSGISNFLDNQLRWQLLASNHAVISVLMSMITVGVTLYLILILDLRMLSIFYGLLSGSIFFTLAGLYSVRKSIKLKFSFKYLRKMLKYSIPLVASASAVWVSQFVDRLMISSLLTISDVGLYGVGYRISGIATLFTIGLSSALMPVIYKNVNKDSTPDDIARIFTVYVGCACMIILSVGLFSMEIVRVVASEKYILSHQLIPIICSAIFFAQMYIFTPGLFIHGKTNIVFYINGFGAILNILLNLLFIPHIGILGAALATLFSSVMVFTSFMFFSGRYFRIKFYWKKISLISLTSLSILLLNFYNILWVDNITMLKLLVLTLMAIFIVFQIWDRGNLIALITRKRKSER